MNEKMNIVNFGGKYRILIPAILKNINISIRILRISRKAFLENINENTTNRNWFNYFYCELFLIEIKLKLIVFPKLKAF